MSRSGSARTRVLTPAVTAAAGFAVIAALFSMTFVTARGGLALPQAASDSPGIALASTIASTPASVPPATSASAAPLPTLPSANPSPAPSASPTPEPSPTPTPTPSPTGRPDPLAALAPCPGHPGCFLYVVRRGDSYTAVNDRYGLLLWITNALNPEVADKGTIVVGQTLYLGRDPEARLDPCPDGAACRLYPVRSGDTISGIASRYGLSGLAILALNPGLDAGHIITGQVIRLPLFAG